MPPTIWSHSLCATSVFVTRERPKAATAPYSASAVAAPSPEAKPMARPSARVRRMQSTPMGPTGAAMEKPMIRPRRKVARSTGC